MRKVLIVGSDETSSWQSSRSIERNLRTAYELALGREFRYLAYTRDSVDATYEELRLLPKGLATVERIVKFRPTHLIFIADSPHLGPLLEALKNRSASGRLPAVTIHVYGNFTLLLRRWLAVATELRAFRIRFVCASPKQAQLISQLLHQPRERISVVRFPVDDRTFRYSAEERLRWRRKLKVADGERLLLYSGRLSLQKNTTALLEEVAKFISSERRPTRLLLVGTFDDIGSHVHGIQFPRGFYFPFWNEVFEGLPRKARERIAYLGDFDQAELCGLYSAADLLVSLSVHHDEDYGMAPAEALCTGLRAVLTDWGGYSSFELDRGVGLVPVEIQKGFPSIRSDAIQSSLRRLLNVPQTPEERKRTSQFYRSRLSCERIAPELSRLLHEQEAPRFQGFSKAAVKYRDSFITGSPDPSFYNRFYKVYRESAYSDQRRGG
ncbi:MAG: glycosyltransferase family 4 protein [Bdellovibrionota bacterium]